MKKTRPISAAIFLILSTSVFATNSNTPVVEKSIPLDWALTAATAASDACFEKGFATTVTIVDQRAQPRVQLMREGAFPHTIKTSQRKAVTAASRRLPTSKVAEINQHEPALGDVFNEIGLTLLSGGVPILHKGDVIAGIGIAGAPGEDANGRGYDDICAEIGIATITKYLK